MNFYQGETYDVIVVGAGHAGSEAALAASRMGLKTMLITLSLDMVAFMPCNPSLGGPATGAAVTESLFCILSFYFYLLFSFFSCLN